MFFDLFRSKTVDGAIGRLDKIVDDLAQVVHLQLQEASVADEKIHEYTVKREEAIHEVTRAQRVRDKVAELIS